MNLLADENVEFEIIDWLRAEGHDMRWISEHSPGATDKQVLDLARTENRFLITYDLDFGELVFQQKLCSSGILLLRLNVNPVEARLKVIKSNWAIIEQRLSDHFVVLTEATIRVRPLTLT